MAKGKKKQLKNKTKKQRINSIFFIMSETPCKRLNESLRSPIRKTQNDFFNFFK